MRLPAIVIGLAIAALAALLLAPLSGPEWISPTAYWGGGSELDRQILVELRIPRVVTGFVAGAALALSGTAFQAVFRNPLATPFTLGVSSGASLGAALAIRLGIPVFLLGLPSTAICAFAGAVLSVALVHGLTYSRRAAGPATVLLAGVAVSYFFSSLILFVQYTSDIHSSFRLVRWLLGGLTMTAGFGHLLAVLPAIAVGAIVVLGLLRELNMLATGEEIAASRGVDVDKVLRLALLASTLMVGGVVSICGPIGFVGLMAPHTARLLVGPDHRRLAPAAALLGGTFLAVCDAVARCVVAPAEMPVGVLTAFFGGPFFLWLLLRRR